MTTTFRYFRTNRMNNLWLFFSREKKILVDAHHLGLMFMECDFLFIGTWIDSYLYLALFPTIYYFSDSLYQAPDFLKKKNQQILIISDTS